MDAAHLARLLAQLVAARDRRAHARELARALGAEELFAFVPVGAKLLPAHGFQTTLPAGRGWRELLARCASTTDDTILGEVAFPTADRTRPAVAYRFAHAQPGGPLCLVLVGPATPDPALHAALAPFGPLLAAALVAESELRGVRGQLEVERDASARAANLARALDLARAEAERAMRVKDELLAMLGHELRNPLAPIVTALQLMRLDGVHTKTQDVIERHVSHLLRLVDDLLDVSRIATGKITLHAEPVELGPIVQRALEMAHPLLEQRQSRLEVDVPATGLRVDGDAARLVQIVTNLLTNAAKHSPPATPIRITAERDDTRIRLAVEDRGSGIDPADLERIFERFVQTPQGIDRSEGGLGLGLAIVQSLVRLHGGTVRAFSEGRDRGSRFVVELPACPAPGRPAAPPPAPAPAPAPTPAASSSTPARAAKRLPTARPASVLVVDDNTDAADLLGEIMTSYGHRVRVVNDGPQALAVLDEMTPDVAILDIGLPAMDGYELAGRLRARLPSIRLVALTGYGRTDDRTRAEAAGFHAHLVKPVAITRVTETLDKLLGDAPTSPALSPA